MDADPKEEGGHRGRALENIDDRRSRPLQDGPGAGIEGKTWPCKFAWGVIKDKPHPFAIDQIRPASRRQALAVAPRRGRPPAVDDEPATISMTTELRDFGAGLRAPCGSLLIHLCVSTGGSSDGPSSEARR